MFPNYTDVYNQLFNKFIITKLSSQRFNLLPRPSKNVVENLGITTKEILVFPGSCRLK